MERTKYLLKGMLAAVVLLTGEAKAELGQAKPAQAAPTQAESGKTLPWYQEVGQGVKGGWKKVEEGLGKGFRDLYAGVKRWGKFDPQGGPQAVMRGRPGVGRGLIFRFWKEEEIADLPKVGVGEGYVWSVETAVARALVANPQVVEAKLMLLRQEGSEREVKGKRLPQVVVVASGERRDPESIDRSKGELILPPSSRTAIADRSYDLRMEVRQVLFDGGALRKVGERERLQTLQAKMALQVAAYRAVALVKQHYEAVLFREVVLGNVKRKEESLGQIAGWAKRRYELGEVAELEYLRAATEWKLAEAEVVRAQSELQQARQGFARHLYLPANATVVLSGELQPKQTGLQLDEALSLAVANRLDLQSGKLQVEAAGLTLGAVRSEALPRLELVAGYGRRSSYYDYTRELEGWTVGVSGRWNVFDGRSLQGRVQVYRAEARVARVRLESLEQQVRSEVAEIYSRLEQARASLGAQGEAKELAGKSLLQAKRAYALGQANLEQVLEMENVYLRSHNAYAETVVSVNAALAQLEFGVGGYLPGGRDVGREVMP